ncbi:MAG: glutamate formiminotransferase, partial [Actinobacteria bacterium]
MSQPPVLLAVPNVSEGADRETIDAIAAAFAPAQLLDVHSDPDHGRSVFTLAARQGDLAGALVAGAREAAARIDLRAH